MSRKGASVATESWLVVALEWKNSLKPQGLKEIWGQWWKYSKLACGNRCCIGCLRYATSYHRLRSLRQHILMISRFLTGQKSDYGRTEFIKALVKLLLIWRLGSSSKVIQVVGWTQFLVVERLRLPFTISNSQHGWKLLPGQREDRRVSLV